MYRHHSAPMYNYVMKRRICVFSLKGGEQKGGPGWSLSPGIWGKGGYCAARGISWKRQNYVDDHDIIYTTCTVYYILDQKHRRCHTCCVADSVDLFPPWDLGEGRILRCLWRDQLKDLCPGGSWEIFGRKKQCSVFEVSWQRWSWIWRQLMTMRRRRGADFLICSL